MAAGQHYKMSWHESKNSVLTYIVFIYFSLALASNLYNSFIYSYTSIISLKLLDEEGIKGSAIN